MTVEDIYKAQQLYHYQQKKVEREQRLTELSQKALCDLIRDFKTKYDYAINILRAAKEELDEKLGDQSHFKWLTQSISEDFFDGDFIVVSSMLWCGMNDYAVELLIDYNVEKYTLQIPLKENLDYKYDEFEYGKFRFFKRGECEWTDLASSYEMADIAKYIKENILV